MEVPGPSIHDRPINQWKPAGIPKEWAKRLPPFLLRVAKALACRRPASCDPLKTVSISWAWKYGMHPSNGGMAVPNARAPRGQSALAALLGAARVLVTLRAESTDGAELDLDTREVRDAWGACMMGAMGHWLDGAEQLFRTKERSHTLASFGRATTLAPATTPSTARRAAARREPPRRLAK